MTNRIASHLWLVTSALLLTGSLGLGCSSDSGEEEGVGVGEGGGMAAGGGAGLGGGAPTGGTTGSASFWPSPSYVPSSPVPADGGYHLGTNPGACMVCHSGLYEPQLAFGGVVYMADGVTPAAGVEIGVSDGTTSHFVYSAANGMYWALAPSAINWPATDIRVRNAAGEKVKLASSGRAADCDTAGCHAVGGTLLTAP